MNYKYIAKKHYIRYQKKEKNLEKAKKHCFVIH